MGMSEREHHIKVLEQFLHDYQEWGEDLGLEETIKYAISSLKTDLKYDLMYEGEEVYTKAEMVDMLTEIQLEIEEGLRGSIWFGLTDIKNIIQQKINSLKENTDGTNTD